MAAFTQYTLLFAGICLSFQLIECKTYICPAYCTCEEKSLICLEGYVMDSTSLRLVDPETTNIHIDNFVIRDITPEHFKWFKNVRNISLTNSRVRSVDDSAFADLKYLEIIDLSHNHLTEIPEGIFDELENLMELNLAGNLIEHLPPGLLTNTTKLSSLTLHNNRLRLLPPDIFDKLAQLEHLDLSHNELTYILPRTFNFISVIRYIDLNDNLLVTLHQDLFDSNNVTLLTKLSVANNPLECNCGMVWLREAAIGNIPHIQLVNATGVVCNNPRIYHGERIATVPLEQLNCTTPNASIVQSSFQLFHKNEAELECRVSGSPPPSILWRTPMGDYITDPYRGEWLDSTVSSTSSEKKYRIYATGEIVHFQIRSTAAGHSKLLINSLHLVSSGEYQCIAINPGGNMTTSINVTLQSSIDLQYYPSLATGACTVLLGLILGIVGCSVTACIDKCSCCEMATRKYYDGAWMRNQSRSTSEEEISCAEGGDDNLAHEDDADEEGELLSSAYQTSSLSSADMIDGACSSSYLFSLPHEINEHTALTAEEWDDYFRQYPDDFMVEGFDGSPRKAGSGQGSPRGSPNQKHGRTLETLEGVRVRLKLRVEQIDVMKERLRVHMEKRGARMKENMERRKLRMNKRMQVIKDTTSQSLQTIKETGRNYSHKLHKGVKNAVENVGHQVQSLKEFCGTGDMGQTLSIATITTDIDTNEKSAITRSETMV